MKIRNKMKKVFSIIVSAMMMVSMLTVTAFAAPEAGRKTGTLTITRNGATFTAYKVLNAELKPGTIVYEYSATTEFEGFFENQAYGNYTVDGIKEINTSDDADAFAAQLEKYAKDNNVDGEEVKGNNTKELPIGYYVVVQTGSSDTNAYVPNKTITVAIPETDDNEIFRYDVVVTPKDSKPSVDKVIVENGSEVKKNDVSIGDDVTYKLTSTVPQYQVNTVEDSIKYYLKDTLSKGLTFNSSSVEVYGVNNGGSKTPLVKDTDYVVNVNGTTEITFDFTGKYANIKNYDSIEITYNATLNENAIIGGAGNPNDVLLGYTNNPNSESGSGSEPVYETPKVEVVTYTYAIGVEKVDATNKTALPGAEFELRDSNGKLVGKYAYAQDGSVVVSAGKVETDANGRVYFIGLDEGTYRLKETKAPNGYILLSGEIEFTITAEKESELPTGGFTVAVKGENVTATETVTINGEEVTIAKITVENSKGFTLPTTGGAGTWMFTIGGLVLMAGAVVVFAVNRKKAK